MLHRMSRVREVEDSIYDKSKLFILRNRVFHVLLMFLKQFFEFFMLER